MRTRSLPIVTGTAAIVLLAAGGTPLGGDPAVRAASKPVRLAAATLIVEVDATVGDAGLQFFLDGEPWRAMTVSAPNGTEILDVDAEGSLKGFGLTELEIQAIEESGNQTFRTTTFRVN
jgi:hypothetical protein